MVHCQFIKDIIYALALNIVCVHVCVYVCFCVHVGRLGERLRIIIIIIIIVTYCN
jgi:hypothetical protein